MFILCATLNYTRGDIEYQDVSLIYSGSRNNDYKNSSDLLKMVLRKISFPIRGGEKIGIVGRALANHQ